MRNALSGPADVDPNPPQHTIPIPAPQLDAGGSPLGLLRVTLEEPKQYGPDEPVIYGAPPLTAPAAEECAVYGFIFQRPDTGTWVIALWKVDDETHTVNVVVEQITP